MHRMVRQSGSCGPQTTDTHNRQSSSCHCANDYNGHCNLVTSREAITQIYCTLIELQIKLKANTI